MTSSFHDKTDHDRNDLLSESQLQGRLKFTSAFMTLVGFVFILPFLITN